MNELAFFIIFALGLTLIIFIQLVVSSQFEGKWYWISSFPFWVLAGVWGHFSIDVIKWLVI